MPEAEKRRLSVCRVGCGSMGRLHGKAILGHANLSRISLCDADPSLARELAGAVGAQRLPLDETLSTGRFDAYFISTPASVHVEQPLRTAPTGAFVFCAKPSVGEQPGISRRCHADAGHTDRATTVMRGSSGQQAVMQYS